MYKRKQSVINLLCIWCIVAFHTPIGRAEPNMAGVRAIEAKEERQEANALDLDAERGEDGERYSLLSPTASLLLALAALITAWINFWYFRRQLRQSEREQDVKRVQNLLDKFYGPFKTLKKTNTNLERLLKLEKKDDGPERREWRTLERLLEGYDFSSNQKVLIETIIEINDELDSLIAANCGLITNKELAEKVHIFRAHHRVIKAAYEGRLKKEIWRFKDYVYPRELDGLIDKEAERLQQHLVSLQSKK